MKEGIGFAKGGYGFGKVGWYGLTTHNKPL